MKGNNFSSCFFTSFFLMLLMTFTFSSCGKNAPHQIVHDVKVESRLVDGDVFLDVSAIFNLGNVSMTAINVTIIDPKNPGETYGNFRILPTLDFKSEIGISVNLSHAAQVPGGEARLPNGSYLPIGGLDQTKVAQLELSDMNARVYVAFAQNTFLLGFAIPIKEFDVVSRYIGASNIFPGFEINGIRGMAGLFTGVESGTSGLAFFIDLSTVVNGDILTRILNGERIDSIGKTNTKLRSGLLFNKGIKSTKAQLSKTQDYFDKWWNGPKRKLHYFYLDQ